jgi:hypothetical protein
VDGLLRDRWLEHKKQPFDLKYLLPGEELRVLRLSDAGKGRAG